MNNFAIHPITVSIRDLMLMLGVGRNKAYQIGKEAGAEVKLGRRCVYNVKKVEEYLENVTRG